MEFDIWTILGTVWTMFGLPALALGYRKLGEVLDEKNDSEAVVFFRNLVLDAVGAAEQNVGRGILQKPERKAAATAVAMSAVTAKKNASKVKRLEAVTGRSAAQFVDDTIEAAVADLKRKVA